MEQRFVRILARARRAHRMHHAMRGAMAAAIAGSAVVFFMLLVSGLGYLDGGVWRLVLPMVGLAVAMGAGLGLLRPLDDDAVLFRLDAQHGLQNALVTAREILSNPGPVTPLGAIHVRTSVERAEQMGLGRTILADLGSRARILGVLCLCVLSVALI